jgi:hypothetical protein
VRRLHKLSLDEEEAGGFVHGSLCPRNFLLTERGDVKVMGLIGCRPIGRVVGREHVPAAALAYASPELLSGAPVTAAVDVHSLGAVLQELLGEAPAADGERDELGAIVRDLLRAGPSAGFTNVDNFAAALQDAVRRTGTVVARQSISAQVRGICEQYLLERRRQVRSLREIEWADQREAATSAPPPSEDVEQMTEGESAEGADSPEPADASLALGEYQEDGGDDAVTRIYDGEDLESEGPSQPQAWMHDSSPPEGARQGWSRWAVVGLLGVLVAVASGAAVMASRSVARAPREVPSAETRVAAASASTPSAGAAAPKAESPERPAAIAAEEKAPAADAPQGAATGAAGMAATVAAAAVTEEAAEEAPARGSAAARRSGERSSGRAVLRKVAAAPKRATTRAASAEAPARGASAETEPATVGVSDLPEATVESEPAAPPSPPPATAPKAAAGKPAEGDLVIEEGQPKMAFLSVDANPYATVFIDGDKKGVTPLVRLELQPGLHRMIARTEDGRTKRFTLQLDAGKTETVKVTWGEGE